MEGYSSKTAVAATYSTRLRTTVQLLNCKVVIVCKYYPFVNTRKRKRNYDNLYLDKGKGLVYTYGSISN